MARLVLRFLPIALVAGFMIVLVTGARATSEGSCSYSSAAGICTTSDCGVTDPHHECKVHDDPEPTHCDCVPKDIEG